MPYDVEDQGCDPMPDACGNDHRAQKLIDRQEKAQRGPDQKFSLGKVASRERNLIIACVAIAVLMNFDTGRYVLYPFQIFSTWVSPDSCMYRRQDLLIGNLWILHFKGA